MSQLPTLDELRDRVRQSIRFYGGTLPATAICLWDGYFAALLEWGMISVSDHASLVDILPKVENNPVYYLFTGWAKEVGK
jgi:hypothetical protein